MPEREEIKPQVVHVLAAVTMTPADDIEETDRLFQDLGMGTSLRQAMSVPYSKISRKYPDGLPLSMKEAGDLKTVGASVELVYKRSNGGK